MELINYTHDLPNLPRCYGIVFYCMDCVENTSHKDKEGVKLNFNIVLFEGTDSIKFGMTHEEIRAILGIEPHLFKKGEFDLDMTEAYKDICHVFYEGSVCVAFEFYTPSQVFYDNTQLMGQERKSFESLFSKLEGYKWKTDSLNAFDGDFSIWGRFEYVESVYINRKGYFAEGYEYYRKKYAEKYGMSF